ncbi:MAG TPA: glycosyltransferase family 4 protein [Gemmatirosa sp.]|nr:glycosyltransferase family 4 protein [Gemmatirosa sp.]
MGTALPPVPQPTPVARATTASGARARRGRVRVALVGPSLDILGGQAVQLQRLLTRLREVESLELHFVPVNPRLPGPLSALQRVKYVRTLVTEATYVASLLRRVPGFDVVHAFSASYSSFLLAPAPAVLAARMLGRRSLVNYRSGEADDHLGRSAIARRLLGMADAIVVPSGYLVDVFARHGLEARSIFNFVEVERIPYRRRPTPRPVFLSNRNLEPMYNVACVLRAFARIQREVPQAELLVAGFGSQRAPLEALAVERGLRNVTFVGRVRPEEMPALYDRADVYLMSPNIDNMPNSVIEAYAAGLPVVTSDAGGVPYIVEHDRTGLLVPRDDDAALAAGALRVLREPGLAARLTDAGREAVLARYTWPAVRDAWTRLYHELAGADAPETRDAAATA